MMQPKKAPRIGLYVNKTHILIILVSIIIIHNNTTLVSAQGHVLNRDNRGQVALVPGGQPPAARNDTFQSRPDPCNLPLEMACAFLYVSKTRKGKNIDFCQGRGRELVASPVMDV